MEIEKEGKEKGQMKKSTKINLPTIKNNSENSTLRVNIKRSEVLKNNGQEFYKRAKASLLIFDQLIRNIPHY